MRAPGVHDCGCVARQPSRLFYHERDRFTERVDHVLPGGGRRHPGPVGARRGNGVPTQPGQPARDVAARHTHSKGAVGGGERPPPACSADRRRSSVGPAKTAGPTGAPATATRRGRSRPADGSPRSTAHPHPSPDPSVDTTGLRRPSVSGRPRARRRYRWDTPRPHRRPAPRTAVPRDTAIASSPTRTRVVTARLLATAGVVDA